MNRLVRKTLAISALLIMLSAALAARTVDFPVSGMGNRNSVIMPLEWDDAWFGGMPATAYNHGMARVAALLSCVAYADVACDKENNALMQCYHVLGVNSDDVSLSYDIDYNDAVWGNDQCAFSIAVKQLSGGGYVVMLVVRGTPPSMNEWLSNLNLNDNGKTEREMHEGFTRAARQVELAVAAFMVKHKIYSNDMYFFITGHSRGAAVANIVAADMAEAKFFSTDRIYAYTFAAPNVTTSAEAEDARYRYIWNIVNGEDVVPTVPLNRGAWNYRKYGQTRVLVNYWNIDASTFMNDKLPRMNALFKPLMGRDYCPWYMGPFIPVQITSSFVNSNRNVGDFYHKTRDRLARLIDKVLLSPAMMGTAAEQDTESGRKRTMLERVLSWMNNRTDGFVDYALKAVNDMHASESYLSWMASLEEDEAFSILGYSQIVIDGREEGAVLDENGTVLARIIEGRVRLSSVKRPVGASLLSVSKVVVGVPGNVSLRFVMTNESLLPTPMKVTVERYNADGTPLDESGGLRVCPRLGIAYQWPLGESVFDSGTLYMEMLRGKEAHNAIKGASLSPKQIFRVAPEAALDTDLNMEVGVRAGNQVIYGTLAVDFPLARRGDRFDICGGIGTQRTLIGPLVLDLTALAKVSWVYGDIDADDHVCNFVPEARAALVLRSVRYFAIFTGAAFDFHIDGMNDAAFYDDARLAALGSISFTDGCEVYPRLMLGIRF